MPPPPPIRKSPQPQPVRTPPPPPQPQPKQVPPPSVGSKDLFEAPKADRELARIKTDAEKTYASLIKQGARIEVTRSAGNNGKPVITVIPPALAGNTDPKAKYDVQVHYHGMHGTISKPNAASHLREQMEASFARKPPTVFVLPEADMVQMKGGMGPAWAGAVRDTEKTAADGVASVTGTRGQLTVSAHSLGRDAIVAAANRGGLKADRVDIQDGFSNNRPDEMRDFYAWAKQHPDVSVRISTGMASKKDIQAEAPFPDATFFKSFRTDHWGAELQPWN